METLVERLEQTVIRLEQVSFKMQASNGMANGACVNGIGGGKSAFVNEFKSDIILEPDLNLQYLWLWQVLPLEVESSTP